MSAESVPPEMVARAFALVCALNDADLPEPTRLLGAAFFELTYGEGCTSLRVDHQERIGALAGIGKGHVREHIERLIEARILLHCPEEKTYEPLPDPARWKVRSRCRLGAEGRRALASDLAARNRQYREGRDFGDLEMTFQRDPIHTAAAEAARESAFAETALTPQPPLCEPSRPPGPGAAGGRSTPPPGITGEPAPAGPDSRLRDKVRQAILAGHGPEGGPKVPRGGTSDAPAHLRPAAKVPYGGTLPGQPQQDQGSKVPWRGTSQVNAEPKVPPRGTFGGQPPPEAGQKFPGAELSGSDGSAARNFAGPPRARVGDCHLDHLDHLPLGSQPLSSASSADQGDEGRGDERGGAGWRQMARLDDELLGDLQRQMGLHMGSHTDDWRLAIGLARPCVYLALEAVKNNWGNITRHPGGYLLQCFLDQCERRGYELPADLFRGARARRKERGGRRK